MKRETKEDFDVEKPLDPQWLGKRFELFGPTISGSFQVSQLTRFSESLVQTNTPVYWTIESSKKDPPNQLTKVGQESRAKATPEQLGKEFWLHIKGEALLRCERCLSPLTEKLDLERGFEFVGSSAEADERTEAMLADPESLDPDDKTDLLAPEDRVSLKDLIEDELLLALPPAPKHADCKPPAEPESGKEPTTRPFADLKKLLKKG